MISPHISCRIRDDRVCAAREANGRSSGKGGHLDYGIDGPLTGDVGMNVELNLGGTEEAAVGTVVSLEAAPDPNASLPYFMQQAGASGAGTSHVRPSAEHEFAAAQSLVRYPEVLHPAHIMSLRFCAAAAGT